MAGDNQESRQGRQGGNENLHGGVRQKMAERTSDNIGGYIRGSESSQASTSEGSVAVASENVRVAIIALKSEIVITSLVNGDCLRHHGRECTFVYKEKE